MNGAVHFRDAEIGLELARLLVGVYAETVGVKRRQSRRTNEHTTEVDCPRLNQLFLDASGGDATRWSSENTWQLLRERWTKPDDYRREVLATRALLFLDQFAGPGNRTKAQARIAAIDLLGFSGRVGPHSIRLVKIAGRETYQSAVLIQIISVLQDDIALALSEMTLAAVADPSDALHGTPAQDPVAGHFRTEADMLDRAPSFYPSQFTVSWLAREMTVSKRRSPPSTKRAEQIVDEASAALSDDPKQLADALHDWRRLVVLGAPGSGKSSLVRGEVIRLLRRGIPAVYARAVDVESALTPEFVASSARATIELLVGVSGFGARSNPEQHAEIAFDVATDSRSLIAIDGLDEVGVDARSAISALTETLERFVGRVVVTSRPLGYRALSAAWDLVGVDAVPTAYAGTFIAAWFGDAYSPEHERALRAVEHIGGKSEAITPVLLGIVATVAEEPDIPLERGRLYDRFIAMVLQREWRPAAEHRFDVVDLSARQIAAARLAWGSATGDTGVVDGGRWRDTVTLEALTRDDHSISAFAQAVVENDALLTPYGASGSRMHQRYVWIHRTVQEHLVGGYLRDLHRDNATRWREQVERAAVGSDQWFEPLVHMFHLLSKSAQADALRELIRIAEEGDPGGRFHELVIQIGYTFELPATVRRRVARWIAGDYRDWLALHELDPDRWFVEWRSAVLGGETYEFTGADEFAQGRPGWLLELAREYRDSPAASDFSYVSLLDRLGHLDPDNALHLYADELLAGVELPIEARWSQNPPGSSAVARALERMATAPPLQQMLLLRCLVSSDVELDWGRAEAPADPNAYRVAALVNALSDFTPPTELDPDDADIAHFIATGAAGGSAAFELGLNEAFDSVDGEGVSPQVRLARVTRRLQVATLGSGDEPTVGAIEVLLRSGAPSFADPVLVVPLMEAALACVESPATISDESAFRLFRHLLALHHNLRTDALIDEPFAEATRALRDAALRLVRRIPVDGRLTMLLDSAPDKWPRRYEYGDTDAGPRLAVAEYLESEEPHARLAIGRSALVKLMLWAAEGNASIDCLPELSTRQCVRVFEAVASRNPRAVTLDWNAFWFLDSLATGGRLFERRHRIVGG